MKSRQTETSESQLAANRANAQLSTGPRSEAGKQIASLNAVKSGLTGRTVLLPTDDAALYEKHVERFVREFKPQGERECELVQSLADTQWRLNRIPGLEMAIFARGRVQFAEKFAEYDNHTAAALIDSETLVVYHKELRNLHLQETRLRRQYANDADELKRLQFEHLFDSPKDKTARPQAASAQPFGGVVRDPVSTAAPPNQKIGFEFLKKVEALDKKLVKLSPDQLEQEMTTLEAHPGNPCKAA